MVNTIKPINSTATNSARSDVSSSDVTIRLDNVSRVFGSTKAVDRLSFSVHRGEVFGFIGPNGAGKTTSMRILSTLDIPTEGHAWVDGFSVVDDPDRVRKRLGWMPDGFGTYSFVNCEEYLDFFARSYGLKANDRRNALKRVMSFTQLDGMANKPIKGLSKGMKQRLCLGRTLIHDPSVLILDEPAAGLDPRARIELREMITALAAEGKTLLVSSHILTELAEMVDRVGIIEQGKLLAVGTVDEILNRQSDDDDEPEQIKARILLQLLNADPRVETLLQKNEWVSEIRNVGREIKFQFAGNQEQQSQLLKTLIDNGCRIVEFASQRKSLEDAFLSVTKGRVQ
jgi:ABC-2 type transport system ATP-binding protein